MEALWEDPVVAPAAHWGYDRRRSHNPLLPMDVLCAGRTGTGVLQGSSWGVLHSHAHPPVSVLRFPGPVDSLPRWVLAGDSAMGLTGLGHIAWWASGTARPRPCGAPHLPRCLRIMRVAVGGSWGQAGDARAVDAAQVLLLSRDLAKLRSQVHAGSGKVRDFLGKDWASECYRGFLHAFLRRLPTSWPHVMRARLVAFCCGPVTWANPMLVSDGVQ